MTPELTYGLLWYGCLAVGLLASLVLFLSAKREIRRLEQKLHHEQFRMREELAACEERIRVNLDRQFQAAANAAAPVTLNVSRRNQALRLHRTGKPLREISEALSIPRSEVDLLLKVHKIVLESF